MSSQQQPQSQGQGQQSQAAPQFTPQDQQTASALGIDLSNIDWSKVLQLIEFLIRLFGSQPSDPHFQRLQQTMRQVQSGVQQSPQAQQGSQSQGQQGQFPQRPGGSNPRP